MKYLIAFVMTVLALAMFALLLWTAFWLLVNPAVSMFVALSVVAIGIFWLFVDLVNSHLDRK